MKLSIAIDMGAKNNGIFITKTDNEKIIDKKAFNIVIDKNSINLSKKPRRENRHRVRNYSRRKLAKRLLWQFLDKNNFTSSQIEQINGLLNNRGYTFLSTSSEFEKLQDKTVEFISEFLSEIKEFRTKKDFEDYFNDIEDEKEIINFINNTTNKIKDIIEKFEIYLKINEILKDLKAIEKNNLPKKEFKQTSYLRTIFDKYNIIYTNSITDEEIGEIKQVDKRLSKLKNDDIVKVIKKYSIDLSIIGFEEERNILKNIKNKFQDYHSKIDDTFKNQNNKLTKKDIENSFKNIYNIIINDLKYIKNTENRTPLSNFLLAIKNEIETGSKPRKKYLEEIKNEINSYDFVDNKEEFFNLIGNISNLQLRILRKLIQKKDYKLLKNYFSMFHWNYNDKEKIQKKKLFEELKKYNNLETFFKQTNPELTIPPYEDMNNRDTYKCNSLLINPKYITKPLKKAISILEKQAEFEVLNLSNLSNSQKLQRILDINSKLISPSLSPRKVFKKNKGDINYYKKLLNDNFTKFSNFAKKYYDLESKAINGVFEDGLLIKCNKNTPSKNNFKHILLKPLYEYDFSIDDVEKFVEKIKQTKGLQTHLKNISDTAKTYQNSFYHYIETCYENKKCIDDKNIKNIIKNLDNDFKTIKEILNTLGFKTYLNDIELKDNLKRVLNTFKQTYEILFKDINGFSKTCKSCTIENNYRSNEKIAKRLLSGVAKPIDGMLDMMLDRIAWEVVSNVNEVDKKVEIILEQNRFLFEDNLASIKGNKTKKRDFKDLLNLNICPYTGENITDTNGEYDHILPQSKELFNSKANLIYCSSKGNREKSNKRVYLNQLNPKHLKEIFGKDNINEIKTIIKENLYKIDKEKFTNFDNLPLKQQIALRYALFFEENTDEFKKAKEILKQDKLKTITNGTQKRLARLIFEKLTQKFKKEIDCNVKVINNFLVSATRKDLSYDHETGEINELWKEKYQDTHSHCIDAMVVFYLANSTIKGTHHQKQHNLATLQPIYKFSDIYLKDSKIINVTKKQTFINAKDISSYKLFDDTIYSEHYHNIYYDNEKFIYYKKISKKEFNAIKNGDIKKYDKKFNLYFKIIHIDIDTLLKYGIIYIEQKNKKLYISSTEQIKHIFESYKKGWQKILKIDVSKTSSLIYKLFQNKEIEKLKELIILDDLRYATSRKEIIQIFFNNASSKNPPTKLLDFNEIKQIPQYSYNLYKAIYKKLKNQKNLFILNNNKSILNAETLNNLLTELFSLPDKHKQVKENNHKRKRNKKRYKYTLPILGNPSYRINRNGIWQIQGNKDIAKKWYKITNEKNQDELIAIPYVSKNVIPLEISSMIDYLKIPQKIITNNIIDVKNIILDNNIKTYIKSLDYKLSEANRLTLTTILNIKSFNDIDFEKLIKKDLNYKYNDEFKKLIDNYINKKIPKSEETIYKDIVKIQKYIGGIRNDKKDAKALLLYANKQTKEITMQYKASINTDKKKIILENL